MIDVTLSNACQAPELFSLDDSQLKNIIEIQFYGRSQICDLLYKMRMTLSRSIAFGLNYQSRDAKDNRDKERFMYEMFEQMYDNYKKVYYPVS